MKVRAGRQKRVKWPTSYIYLSLETGFILLLPALVTIGSEINVV